MNWGELITFHPTITIPILKHHQVPLVTPEVAATVATSKAPGPQARQSRATMSAVVNFPSITQLQARELWENQQNILIYIYRYIYIILYMLYVINDIYSIDSHIQTFISIYIYTLYIHANFILNEKYLVCKVFLRMPYPWRKLSSIISPGIGHSRLVDHSTIQPLCLDGFHSQLQQDFLHPTTVSCLKPSIQSWRFNHPPKDIPPNKALSGALYPPISTL
jgi:hypothetical protein